MGKVEIRQQGRQVSINNNILEVVFDLETGEYSAKELDKNLTRLKRAKVFLDRWAIHDKSRRSSWQEADCRHGALGKGRTLRIISTADGQPTILFDLTLYEGRNFLDLNCGLINTTEETIRLCKIKPLLGRGFIDADFSNFFFLDGKSNNEPSSISKSETMECTNNLLALFGDVGKWSALVIGGLTYHDFEKFVRVDREGNGLRLEMWAQDPVGKRVDPGMEYMPDDHFYIDFCSDNPFDSLEQYAHAVRAAQEIHWGRPTYPIINMWYTHWKDYGGFEFRNNTPGVVQTADEIHPSGFHKYSPVGIRIEPDFYGQDNFQGWWDDEHYRLYELGQYIPPYETSVKWAKAVIERGGVPFTYVQTARRSEDYCRAYPDHILFNDPEKLRSEGNLGWWNEWEGDRCWGYDFTDPGFIEHMQEVYRNFREAGIRGIKFDYPETGWAYEGGFEDPYATTGSAYRNIFKLAHDGMGPDADIHERMARGDLAVGLITTKRIEGDIDKLVPPMVGKAAFRWYKNRVLYNLDMDAMNPFAAIPPNIDGVRAMFTMTYVVSGNLELGVYLSKMTREWLYIMSRIFPFHTRIQSARPLDLFAGKAWPQVFDFEVEPGWHQLAFYNTELDQQVWPSEFEEYKALQPNPKNSTVGIALSGDPVLGSVGLDPDKCYYIYDFWNDCLLGKYSGAERLEQELHPGEARMMSIHETVAYPQFISTNRHIMQGMIDVVSCEWNEQAHTLSGVSKVVADDPYKVMIMTNGYQLQTGDISNDAECKTGMVDDNIGLLKLEINSPESLDVRWILQFWPHPGEMAKDGK